MTECFSGFSTHDLDEAVRKTITTTQVAVVVVYGEYSLDVLVSGE